MYKYNKEVQLRANKKYKAKTYKRVAIDVRKEDYETIQTCAANQDLPVATWIKMAIKNQITADHII